MNQAFLDPPQQELLVQLVETERSVAIEDRGKWIVSQALSRRDQFLYGGKKHVVITGAVQDVEVLASVGLVAISYTPRGTMNFFVMPYGFRYYENLMHSDSPAESTVEHMKQHLSTYDFKSAYAAAFDRWSRAELLLWSSESQQQLTTIGHLCREAMQEFADSLVTRFNLGDSYPDKTKIVARVRAGTGPSSRVCRRDSACPLDRTPYLLGNRIGPCAASGAWRPARIGGTLVGRCASACLSDVCRHVRN
jgi:hypothetical protein